MDYTMVKAIIRDKRFDGHWTREIPAQVWLVFDIAEYNVLAQLINNQAEYSSDDWRETMNDWIVGHTTIRSIMLDQYNKSGFVGTLDLLQFVHEVFKSLKHDLESKIDCYAICREFKKYLYTHLS